MTQVDIERDEAKRNRDHFCLCIEPFDKDQLTQYFKARDIKVKSYGERYGSDGNEIELRESN